MAPISWFNTIAEPVESATAGSSVTITGPHTFKAGYGWLQMYTTKDTQEFKLEPIGDEDSESGKITGEMFNPGDDAIKAEFARHIKNHQCIVVTKSLEGRQLQWGTKELGVKIAPSYTTAKVSGGKRGMTYAVSGYQLGLLIYEGALPLKADAVVTP
ncbi:hypothetical protein [Sabulibacter ruber]|uniref:hypothetical protein n=1 Tax=Sabulibacter ruber TaxID=2811901 RepID=UPI001A974524|nr:hypothetical protein [Sabulibacter ruber]